jgi:predicted nucleic acid-binding protein
MLLLDNTVLSNFASISQIELLILALGDRIAITKQVLDEFNAGIRTGRLPETKINWLAVIELETEENALYQKLLTRVNAGEASCLAIAKMRNGRVLTDDRDARKLAAQLQIPISGTLGILLRLIQIEALTFEHGNTLLQQMIAKGYRSPVQRLEDL